MLNSVVQVGRLATDVELSYTPSGKAVANFRIAVKDAYKKDAQGKPGAHFFDVRVWGQPAEFAANYLAKGRDIGIKGELAQESWEKDGRTFSKVVIVAREVTSIGPNPNGTPQPPAQAAPAAQPQAPPPAPAAPAPAPAPVAAPPATEYDPFADDV